MPSCRIPSGAAAKIALFLIIGFLAVAVPPAQAIGNLHLGPLRISPAFTVTEKLDDNVCREVNEKCPDPDQAGAVADGSDLITLFEAGVDLVLPLRAHRVEGSYSGRYARYNEFKSENFSDNTLGGGLQLNFNRGYSVHFKEEWVDGHDPRGFNQNPEIDFFRKNTVEAGLGLTLGTRLRLAGDFSGMKLNYAENSLNRFRDRTENRFGGTVFIRTFPKTYLLLSFDSTAIQFDEDNTFFLNSLDSSEQRAWFGISWNASPDTQGTIKGGWVQKDYDEIDAHASGGIAAVAIKHAFSSTTDMAVTLDYDLEESNVENQIYYRKTVAGVRYTRQIQTRFTLGLRGAYSRDKYPDDDVFLIVNTGLNDRRLDNTWEIGGAITYNRFEWLNFGIDYLHAQRKSTIEVFDYSANVISLAMKIKL